MINEGNNIVLTAGTAGIFINGVPYAKNTIIVRNQGEDVGLYHKSQPTVPIVMEQKFDFYLSAPTIPFASYAALMSFLNLNI